MPQSKMQKSSGKSAKILAKKFMVKPLHLRNKIFCDTLLWQTSGIENDKQKNIILWRLYEENKNYI